MNPDTLYQVGDFVMTTSWASDRTILKGMCEILFVWSDSSCYQVKDENGVIACLSAEYCIGVIFRAEVKTD